MPDKNPAKQRIEEDFSPVFPPDNIICKDCAYRKRDIKDEAGKMIVHGHKNGYCGIYTPEIRRKPTEILFDGADCKYYVKEES